jgi:hypothetical protein
MQFSYDLTAGDLDVEQIREQAAAIPWANELLTILSDCENRLEAIKLRIGVEFKSYGLNITF